MADEPFFPPPREDEETAYRTPGERIEAPASAEEPRRAPIVAQRAEPPPEDDPAPGAKKPMPMLTPDEVRSLLATTEAASSSRALARCARRSVIFVPVGLIRTFASALLGDFATIVSIVLFVAALAWISLPLWRRDRDGWL